MSFSLTSLSQLLFLFFLRVGSVDPIHAGYGSSLSGFEVPEMDGSAVDDTCKIFFVSTPDTPTPPTTPPVTKKVVVTTAEGPAVQTPPARPQQAAGHSNAAVNLLHQLLANSRGHAAGFQPIGRPPLRAYGVTSDSDESAPTWTLGSFSSEDSSDES